MGLLSGIMSKIFGHPAGNKPAPSAATPVAASFTTPAMVPVGAVAGVASPTQALPTASPPPADPPVVDVASVLDQLAASTREKLDWRHSIVDLMKLVGIDSSLSARKELARELDYQGDTGDSARMNIWLHRQVIQKIAANGGKVPPDLLD